ncbi:MAG: MFS transporter [Acidimicrobiia bacterium]|nr:MFS transporter [Acidimicrobiia bacterium]
MSTSSQGAAPRLGRLMAMSILVVAASAVGVMLLGAGIGDIGPDLEIGPGEIGILTAAFFTAAAITSSRAGRIVERIGWQRAVRINAVLIGLILLSIASLVDSPWTLGAALALMGATYSLANPAANQALADHVHPSRRGSFFGLKHAGIPTATLLAGAAVPLIILNFGWRAAYGCAAVMAFAIVLFVPRGEVPATAEHHDEDPRRTVEPLPTTTLRKLAVAGTLATIGVVGLSTYLVASLVEDGFSDGAAGWLQFGGALFSVLARVSYGVLTDRTGTRGFAAVSALYGVGAFIYLSWIPASGTALALLVIVAYATAWGWPGLYTYSVVNANTATAAASSGVSQAGIFTGAALGPLVVGQIIERASFDASWAFIAGCLLAASFVMASVNRTVVARPSRTSNR